MITTENAPAEPQPLTGRELDNQLAEKLFGYSKRVDGFVEGAMAPWPITVFQDWPGPRDNCHCTSHVRVGESWGKRAKKPFWLAPDCHRDVKDAFEALGLARMLLPFAAPGEYPDGDVPFRLASTGRGGDDAYSCTIGVLARTGFMGFGATEAEAIARAALKVSEHAEAFAQARGMAVADPILPPEGYVWTDRDRSWGHAVHHLIPFGGDPKASLCMPDFPVRKPRATYAFLVHRFHRDKLCQECLKKAGAR
jgi:hypothetical protein